MNDEDRQRDDDRKRFEDWAVRNIPAGSLSLCFNTEHQLYPDLHTDRYYRTWLAALSHRDKRVEELEAVVAKLPKTADGKVVTDPTELYWWNGNVLLRGAGAMTEACIFCDPNEPGIEFHPNGGIGDCYSAREAAEAARKEHR